MKMSKKKRKEEASLQYYQGKKAYEVRDAEKAYEDIMDSRRRYPTEKRKITIKKIHKDDEFK